MSNWMANNCDGQLPILSTVGRGPKGESMTVRQKETEDGVVLEFVSDIDGKVLYTTPNLSFGELSIVQDPSDPTPGQDSTLTITVVKDGETVQTATLKLPRAIRGTAVFSCTEPQTRSSSGRYTLQRSTIVFNNVLREDIMVGDLVFIQIRENYGNNAALGVISSFDENTVTILVRNEYDTKAPWIGPNGNWYIGKTDTGTSASGTPGETPYIGDNGNWWIGDVDTYVQAQGPTGEGLELDGSYPTFEDLTTSVRNPNRGDTYLVSGVVYVWNGFEWVDNGHFRGPVGKSAYEQAVEGGYQGTEYEFIKELAAGTLTRNEIIAIWNE